MKRTVTLFLLTIAISVVGLGQDKPKTDAPKTDAPKADAKPAAATPTVDEILDKFVKAVGGKEALEKNKSRVVKGTFEIEAMNISGPFENYEQAPNKNSMTVQIPNMGNFNTVFDGTKGWDSNPMTGLRELAGVELEAMKRDSDFYSPLNFKKNFAKLAVIGQEKVGTANTYVVEATPAGATPEKYYFDVESGLLLRQDSERETPQGKIASEQYFEDYKVVDGVKIAHTLKQVTPMYAMTIKMSEIKHNVEISPEKFNKPAAN